MECVPLSPFVVVAAALALLPCLAAAFFADRVRGCAQRSPRGAQLFSRALLCVPYGMVGWGAGCFGWSWLRVYALLPVGVALVPVWASRERGRGEIWPVLCILVVLGGVVPAECVAGSGGLEAR